MEKLTYFIKKNELFYFLAICFLFNTYNFNLFGYQFYIGFIGITLLSFFHFYNNFSFKKLQFLFTFPIIFFLLWNFFTFIIHPNTFYLGKMIISITVFIYCFFLGVEICKESKSVNYLNLPKQFLFIYLFVICFLLIEFIFPEYFPNKLHYQTKGIYSGLFYEPSFYAFCSIGIASIAIHIKGKYQYYFFILFGLSLILSPSMTNIFLSIILLISYFFLNFKKNIWLKILIFLILTLFFFLRFTPENYNYYLQRFYTIFFFVDDSTITGFNYYHQGFLDAKKTFFETYGLGSGFNRMGSLPRESSIVLESLSAGREGVDLHLTDGSALIFKIVYELGIYGLFIVFFIIKNIFLISFKNIFKKIDFYEKLSFTMSVAMLFIFFTRSVVYFDYLYFSFIFYLFFYKKSLRRIR